MPDRYDPKLSVRPPGERKTAETPSDSDPLAELARIVSGRPPFDPTPAAKAKSLPAAVQPEPDVERDLEAELLNDLQASFAAIREPLESVGAAVADDEPEAEPEPEPPPPPPPVARAAQPPPRLPEPKIAPPRRPDPVSFDIGQAIDQAFEDAAQAPVVKPSPPRPDGVRPYVPPLRGPASGATRTEPPARTAPPAGRASPPVRAEHMPLVRSEPAPPKADRPAASTPQPAAERPSLLRRVVAPRGERPNLPVRPLAADEEALTPEVPAQSRAIAPKPPRAEPATPASRFAPPKAAIAPPPAPRRPAPPEPVVEPPFEDDFELADLAGELDGPFEDEFTLDDLDAAAYGPDEEFPPFPEEELASLKRRRTGRVFAVIAGLLAIVAIGGAAVFLYRSDATGSPPPIIAADSGPTKVPPDETAAPAETDPQGKLIYDRVDGSDTTLVTGDAEVGDIPAADAGDANNPITRVIIPGGPGVDPPGTIPADGEAVIAEADPAPDGEDSDIGPRMVRTVVVKPDGTIVSSEATGVDEDGNALPASDEAAGLSLPEPERTEMDAVLEGGDLAVNTDPLSNPLPPAEAPAAEPPAAPEAEAIPTPPAAETPAAAEETPAALRKLPSPEPEPPAAPAAPAPEPEVVEAAPTPAPPPPPAETQVAARDTGNGPINLTPGTAPAAGAPRAGGGGVLVQVTAQRSEEAAAAAYRNLQKSFPSILGAFQPTIVRADLGDRGVYYRVRVGPFNGGDATRLCDDLKAAGGDCILAR
jgi:hypothetical protein